MDKWLTDDEADLRKLRQHDRSSGSQAGGWPKTKIFIMPQTTARRPSTPVLQVKHLKADRKDAHAVKDAIGSQNFDGELLCGE